MYGDPMLILERKQQQEANQRKRGTLHVKNGWSKERQAAEDLFLPAASRSET